MIGKGREPESDSLDDLQDDEGLQTQRVGVRTQPRAATISPPPVWSDHLLHHQKRQSRLRRDWPSMPRLVLSK